MSAVTVLRLSARQVFRPRVQGSPLKPVAVKVKAFGSSRVMRAKERESINTEANEYSKSGTDDAAAKQEKAAFDPGTTDPQAEREVAGKGKGAGNPLDVSPANPEVSKQNGQQQGGAENSGKE